MYNPQVVISSPTPTLAPEDYVSEDEGINQEEHVIEAEGVNQDQEPSPEVQHIPHLPSVTITPSVHDRNVHELGDGGTPLVDQGHDQNVIVPTPQDAGNLSLASPWNPPIPSHLLSHTATEEVSFLICTIFSKFQEFISFK